jgi:hypothetical protein
VDRRINLQRALEALQPLLLVVEADDVDRAQVHVRARHHRVRFQVRLLPEDQRLQQRALRAVPFQRLVVVERLLVHLDQLLDRRGVLSARDSGKRQAGNGAGQRDHEVPGSALRADHFLTNLAIAW